VATAKLEPDHHGVQRHFDPHPNLQPMPMTDSPNTVQSWLAHLSLRRIITSNRFIPEVDGFRFIAILIVIVSHVYVQCGPVPGTGAFAQAFAFAFEDGKRGVYLFFTISGFILALPFARHHLQEGNRVNVLSYFRRRLTRLEPPYVLAMLLRTPAVLFIKHTAIATVGIHLLATLFYVHSIVFAEYSTINPPAWSLEVEIQFYLLAPLLTAIFMVRSKTGRRALMVAIILLSGILANTVINPTGRLSFTLLYFFQYFMAGFLLCDFYLCGDNFSIPTWLYDLLGTAALVWILFSRAPWYPVALPFATLILYMAGFHGTVCRAIFSFRPISLIGGMCYSIYLTHSTILTAMTPVVHRITASALPVVVQFPLIFGSCCAAVLLIGTIYFVLIERPCMDPAWPHKLAMKLRRA
jgi:peptidoglycan/LPS O-acetylase OafA/YrhL